MPRRQEVEGRRWSFFVEEKSGTWALSGEEAQHAARVLRLKRGARIVGLDGAGGRTPLELVSLDSRGGTLEATGATEREPEPGAPGSPVGALEVAVAWPRPGRGEWLLDQLTQVGVHRVHPLVTRHAGPQDQELSPSRRRRLERVLREACKQSGRAWLPKLEPAVAPGDLALPGPAALADPEAPLALGDWLGELDDSAGSPGSPLAVLVGPEGGFHPEDREALVAGGAQPVGLGPHVLRIETAAVVAAAACAARLWRRQAP